MNKRRRKRTIICLSALLVGLQPCLAQDVAQLTPTPVRGAAEVDPISDGGMDWLALAPAEQLLITFRSNEASELKVEVLNERGELVLARRSDNHPGRTLFPLNVSGLSCGRYVLRVEQGGATCTSRFLRP